MEKSNILVAALAIIIAVLLVFFFKGRADLKDLRGSVRKIEKTNKQLQTENAKLKASLLRYIQVADSLNAAIENFNDLSDEVNNVISGSIASFSAINSKIGDILAESNTVINSSEGATSDDSLQPIIP
ncbi:hypothetical protein [Salinivirga cyanobacteriivorans]